MRRTLRKCLGLAVAGLASLPPPSGAQEGLLKPFRTTEDGLPVMRAEPVRPPKPLPSDPVAAPAVPVSPRTKGKPTPPTAAAVPAQSPEPADPSEIRIAPQDGSRTPDQAQIAVADSYYSRKLFDVAAGEYQRYLDNFPGGADVPAAMFRLAESHRKNGSLNSAKSVYENLLARFQAGEFSGPAAYRLADLYYQERNYTAALPLYRKASARLKEPSVVNAAKFYQARCLESSTSLGNKLEALDLYRDLAEVKENNPFMDASRLSVALLLHDANRTGEALKNIQLLGRQTQNPDLKAQAVARTGLWELELKQNAEAEKDLKKALALPEIGPWREEAQLGLLRVYYETGRYPEVVSGYAEYGRQLSKDAQPELLLLVANSEKRAEHADRALALYEQIVRDYPNTVYASEANYEQLVTLYNTNSDQLVTAIDAYLTGAPDPLRRDKVMLMKAESLLKKQDFLGAAAVYGPVSNSSQLPGSLRAEALYKLGWCAMQTRDYERATKAYSQFIDAYPTHKSLCSARVQRAIAQQSLKNLAAAEKDYVEVIRKFDKCPERELALQQEALIRGQQNDNAGMADYFAKLLKEYPQTSAAAQAHFWIGRTMFEMKDYKNAVGHLGAARSLDKEQFFERASLPLMLAYHYLEDRSGVAKEVESYRADGKGQVPLEVLRWLADSYFENKDFASAEKYLGYVTVREEVAPRDLLRLGETRLELAKYPEAVTAFQKYLPAVKEPISRATGLLALARAQIGSKDFAAAQKSVEECLTLQPEGRLSGEGRIVAGDIEAAREHWDEAAKVYASVAVILGLDDEEVTPRALEKAYKAYQKAGREAEAKKTLNMLQSRYPEYFQKKKVVN